MVEKLSSVFPPRYSNERLWIGCNEDKSPRVGSSRNPVFTLSEVPAGLHPGFVFRREDKLVGIDIDSCISDSGELTSATQEFLGSLPANTYIEHSISGRGLHIIGRCEYEIPHGVKKAGLEIYQDGRYFLLTGDILDHNGKVNGEFSDLTEVVRQLVGVPPCPTVGQSLGSSATEEELERVKLALAELDPDCSYDEWSRYGLAIGNTFKHSDLRQKAGQIFARWSKKGKKFDTKAKASIASFFDPSIPIPSTCLTLASLYAAAPQILVKEQDALFDDEAVFHVEHPQGPDDNTKILVPPRGPKLSFVTHCVQVADKFIDQSHCFTQDGKLFSLWDGQEWHIKINALYLEKTLMEFIFAHNFNWLPVKGGGFKETLNPKSKDIHEVLMHVKRRAALETPPVANRWRDPSKAKEYPYVIAVRGGLYSITEDKIIGGFTPDFYNTAVLPCSWNPEAVAPRFLEGLRLAFSGDNTEEEIEDNVECLQLWFGYLLLVGRNEKKCCLLLGDSNSGKSTILRMMEMLVGDRYYKALTAKGLDGSRTDFGVGFDSHLVGGLDEFPFDRKLNKLGEIIKLCTGDTRIEKRALFSEGETVEVSMRFVFTSNTSPEFFSDPMGGLMNRFLIWRCSALPEAKIDTGFREYVKSHELEGVLTWAVRGAQKLIGGAKLRQPGGASKVLRDEFRAASRGFIEEWVEEAFEECAEGVATNNEILDLLKQDRSAYEWRAMSRFIDEKQWSQKTIMTKVKQAILGTVFPAARPYKNSGVLGFRGIKKKNTELP